MMDHALYAVSLGIQAHVQEMRGKLVDVNGNEMILSSPNRVGVEGHVDIIELGVLLKAAGVDTLDSLGNFTYFSKNHNL